jgi:uncharacterized protein (TIGR02284 family)
MDGQSRELAELIVVLRDGEAFYAEAAETVSLPAYRYLFRRMSRTKQAIANNLALELEALGAKPPSGRSWVGSIRQCYTECRAKLSSDKDALFVVELEEVEDRIVQTFQNALTTASGNTRHIVDTYLPEVLRNHQDMQNLKRSLAIA